MKISGAPSLKFQHQVKSLVWKAYLQRIRKWKLLTVELIFSFTFCLLAVYVAYPVFLTPLQDEPEPPLATADLLQSIQSSTVVGYAPQQEPYTAIMERVSEMLNIPLISAKTIEDLNVLLYNRSKGEEVIAKVIWVIFESHEKNIWKFSICSTEMARFAVDAQKTRRSYNLHLRAGFLAVQLSVSQVILESSSPVYPQYELSLVSMPVSPLMEEDQVRQVISWILLCYTLALLPPIMDTVEMVVQETRSGFKRSLRLHGVSYAAIYVGWMMYALFTAMPVCLMGSLTLILIFRWIHLFYVLVMLLCYFGVMMMMSFIMSMYHSKGSIACIVSMLFTLMQTFLAELIIHHRYDEKHQVLTFVIHVIVPAMGLVHGFNQFALLQTGKDSRGPPILLLIGTWLFVSGIYFHLLMALQYTIGGDKAIGGQKPWRSILFKRPKDRGRVKKIEAPTGREREKLQEVDELVAKAISFKNVSKSIMGVPLLTNVTFDIYRGEFTNIYSMRIQEKMMNTLEDLLTGLTHPDSGTINMLGEDMKPGRNFMTEPHMLGYCHRSKVLIPDLTVEEHFILFASLCLWSESNEFVSEYTHMRMRHLLPDGFLESLVEKRVKNLDIFYRAQLCWALALLLEPRIVIMPNFTDQPHFMSVMKDKIMTYRKHLTIIKLCFSSVHLEFSDRVFILDQKIVCFGGTPAYMYFTYGREYRVRLNFKTGANLEFGKGEDSIELLDHAKEAGATVRAYLGSLLILKLPTSPTHKVAAFIKHLHNNSEKYGIVSMNISLPDSEEVVNRCIFESRMSVKDEHELDEAALHRISAPMALFSTLLPEARDPIKTWPLYLNEPRAWKREMPRFLYNCHQLRRIGWKYCLFYCTYKTALIITISISISQCSGLHSLTCHQLIAASLAGVFIGLTLSSQLLDLYKNHDTKKLLRGELLTVEALEQMTVLVLRLDDTPDAKSVANAYVLSATDATEQQVNNMAYTALLHTESLTEYLVTRAIDSPQKYVFQYAYGMDVGTNTETGKLSQYVHKPIYQFQILSVYSDKEEHFVWEVVFLGSDFYDRRLPSEIKFIVPSFRPPYVLSATDATEQQVNNMAYTALLHTESLTEYLVTRAIDSPQKYVFQYAYGMDVGTNTETGKLSVQALYSPLHKDVSASARSLARAHTSLLRHYTGDMGASIEIIDNPLLLDLTHWMTASTPPFTIQFLLILTTSHITLVPSNEHGLIRHLQKTAISFSPASYWAAMFFWDMVLYLCLVALSSCVMIAIILMAVPVSYFNVIDLVIIPWMLLVYGIGCIPQAYLFSLGPRPTLNGMAFMIFNIVFGEATVLAKFYEDKVGVMNFLLCSPQFNIAYALVKISKIFLYNSECTIFRNKKLCSAKMLHKCCQKCGVLQKCFQKQSYISTKNGILLEICAILVNALVLTTLLLLWEYNVILRLWYILMRHMYASKPAKSVSNIPESTEKERAEVLAKLKQIKKRHKQCNEVDTFGEYLLANELTKNVAGVYTIIGVSFGLAKGEALAVSGLKRHGRLMLCELVSGFKMPTEGNIWAISKRDLKSQPISYSRNVSLCCDHKSLPDWLTVKECLDLIGILRGVPPLHLRKEIRDIILLLDLKRKGTTVVKNLSDRDRKKLHFAASVIGAPPVIVLDEFVAHTKYSVRRAMYYILYQMRRKGHALLVSSSNVENHMPVTNRLAFLLDGRIFDIDHVDTLLERYGNKGYTVVVHLKDEVDITTMFGRYFKDFTINDTTEVLVNIQVFDDLDWAAIFAEMERLKAENHQVYSYIVTSVPLDYIYNKILSHEVGLKVGGDLLSYPRLRQIIAVKHTKNATPEMLRSLKRFQPKYDITTLKELPWSVIFNR